MPDLLRNTRVISNALDPDLLLFLNAPGMLLSANEIRACDVWVKSIKAGGVWTKIKAFYRVVGGTATTHKYNFKDPRDLDAAFRLAFTGGWTHSATGMLPNGTTGYANTFLIPSTSLALGSAALGYYSRTDNTSTGSEMGCRTASTQRMEFYMRETNGNSTYAIYDPNVGSNARINGIGTLSNKLHIASRTSTTQFDAYRDGTSVGTATGTATGTLPTHSIYLAAQNNGGTAGDFSNRECAGALIADALSSADVTVITNAENIFQAMMGRSV